jgi:hypothetical protein
MALSLWTTLAFSQRIVIYLDNAPNSTPSVSKATLRYDKDFAYSFTFDDNSTDAYTCGLPALQGGFVAGNNTTYTGLAYTDGCGNSIPFRAGIAWNAAGGTGLDNHTGNVPSVMTWGQLDDLYDKGWDVFNHSLTHRARWLGAMTASDYIYEINQNLTETRNKTRNRIEMPTFVVPSGDGYYQDIAYAQGQKIVFDQSANSIGIGGLSVSNDINFNGQVVHRTELDNELATGGNSIGNVANRAAAGDRIWFNEFTHHVDNFGASAGVFFPNFRSHVERIANNWGKNGNDRMWMAPLQEVLDYLTTRQTATYTATLNGNQLTIDFNMQGVPTGLRRRPITLVVNSSANFSRVDVSQGVQMTFNGSGSKKIINLDLAGASAVVTADPCLTDVTPPIVNNCPQNINLTTSGINAQAFWTAPTASDNCGTPSLSSNFSSGASFPIGTSTVTYTATDARNNRSTCSFRVVVTQSVVDPCANDVVAPVFANCPTNINLTTSGNNATANWTAPTATDNCSNPTISSNFSSGATFPIGTTTVSYTATDARNNRSTCSFRVVVTQTVADPCLNDVVPPVLSNCPQNINLTTTGTDAVANWIAPAASDNCSNPSVFSNYTSGSNFPIGSTTVTYTAIDGQNNSSTCSFNVVVSLTSNTCANDVTPPVFQTCPQDVRLTTALYSAVANWTTPTVTDDCTASPILTSNYANNMTFPVGTTAIIYAATDDKNNRSTCGFNVIITRSTGNNACASDVTAPVLRNCPTNFQLTTTGTTAIGTWTAPTATDNCTASPTISSNFASGQSFPIGSTSVTYAATDAKGNRATCSFAVSVVSIVVGDICASKSDAPWQEWVSKVQFNILNHVSEKTRSDRYVVGYSDWRDLSTTVNQNKTYPLSISASESYSLGTPLYYRAWIDFNGNGFFDTAEKVLEVTNNGKVVATQSVKIPVNAALGSFRMRISMKKGSYPAPCETFANGEVEDYTVNIISQFATPVPLAQLRPSQQVPIVIKNVLPNPTNSDVFIKLDCLDKRTVRFDFYNAVGTRVKSESQQLEKGLNTVGFDFSDAPQGVYFIQTDVGKGREVPTKFIKM